MLKVMFNLMASNIFGENTTNGSTQPFLDLFDDRQGDISFVDVYPFIGGLLSITSVVFPRNVPCLWMKLHLMRGESDD